MTRSTYYVPELGVMIGARADEDAVRWDLILRWGDQVAGSKHACPVDTPRFVVIVPESGSQPARVEGVDMTCTKFVTCKRCRRQVALNRGGNLAGASVARHLCPHRVQCDEHHDCAACGDERRAERAETPPAPFRAQDFVTPKPKTKVFRVSFDLEVEDGADEIAVEEAVTQAWDDETGDRDEIGTRCGVKFLDATGFSVALVERRG